MIIVARHDASEHQLDEIRERIESAGVRTTLSRSTGHAHIACSGQPLPDAVELASLQGVASVLAEGQPHPLASRSESGATTRVRCGDHPGAVVGGRELALIAGPCSVEGLEMLEDTARAVRAAGAGMLRGGAFKPRTSPYAFQGLGGEGLAQLAEVRRRTGMPVVTEVMEPRQVEEVAAHADVLQVGARNMQNYPLLIELGRVRRPVVLKRGLSATVRELLLAAEYILAQGNPDVILCERGIRGFDTATRNTLDVGAIALLKRESHLPVLADPSHASGRADLVAPLACAAVAAGADGLMIEVHPNPARALSDGEQSLTPAAFAELVMRLRPLAHAVGRALALPDPGHGQEAA